MWVKFLLGNLLCVVYFINLFIFLLKLEMRKELHFYDAQTNIKYNFYRNINTTTRKHTPRLTEFWHSIQCALIEELKAQAFKFNSIKTGRVPTLVWSGSQNETPYHYLKSVKWIILLKKMILYFTKMAFTKWT